MKFILSLLFLILSTLYIQSQEVQSLLKETRVTLQNSDDSTKYCLRVKTRFLVPPDIDVYHTTNVFNFIDPIVEFKVYMNGIHLHTDRKQIRPSPWNHELRFVYPKALSKLNNLEEETELSSVLKIEIPKDEVIYCQFQEAPIEGVELSYGINRLVEWEVIYNSEIPDFIPFPVGNNKDFNRKLHRSLIEGIDTSIRYFPLLHYWGISSLQNNFEDKYCIPIPMFYQKKNLIKHIEASSTVKISNSKRVKVTESETTQILTNCLVTSGRCDLPPSNLRTKDKLEFEIHINSNPKTAIPVTPKEFYEEKEQTKENANPIYSFIKENDYESDVVVYSVFNLDSGSFVKTDISYYYKSNYFTSLDDFTTRYLNPNKMDIIKDYPYYLKLIYPSDKVLIEFDSINGDHFPEEHSVTYVYETVNEVPDFTAIVYQNENVKYLKACRWITIIGGLVFIFIVPILSRFPKLRNRINLEISRPLLNTLVFGVYAYLFEKANEGQDAWTNFLLTRGYLIVGPLIVYWLILILAKSKK